ncbi:MAG: NYN domain-containing protein [Candidatus Uhrbacteria bacterium]
MISRPDQRVAVFIDTQNMYYSARNVFNQKVNFGNIVKDAVGERKLVRAIAYVVSTKTGEETAFFEALKKLGIETKEKELMEYASGLKKADWDVGIAVDAIKILDMVDAIVLVSGDGDFIPLVEYIEARGRIMEVVAFRETTSSRLIERVDKYTNLSENKKRYLITTAPKNKKTNN